MSGFTARVLLAGAAATLLVGSAAQAQTFSSLGTFVPFQGYSRGRNVSVLERDRPEYAALGVRAGSFIVYPQAQLTAGTIDNLFATANNKTSDTYLQFAPSLSANSDWSRHSVALHANLQDRRYADNSSENFDNWAVDASGRFELVGDSYLAGGVETRRDHLTRDLIAFPIGGGEPAPVTTKDAFARAVYQSGRIRALGNLVVANVNFSDIKAASGGVLDQDSRDFDSVLLMGRADYAISPDTALFAEVRRTNYKYDTTLPSGAKRNSDQTEALVGANFDLTSLLRGEVALGHLRRSYDDPSFRNISGLALRGQVEYFPTALTTVTFNARRSVEDSILNSAGGYISTYSSVRVDHELLRNLLLKAEFGYENDDFRGADRSDKIKDLSVGASYLLSRAVGVSATYTYRDRNSSGALRGPSFEINRFAITLTVQR